MAIYTINTVSLENRGVAQPATLGVKTAEELPASDAYQSALEHSKFRTLWLKPPTPTGEQGVVERVQRFKAGSK